ncbi:MAG: hypothetical protein HYY48_07890 [Gammaproteobacteria bacterium]|nr:hypothetical protein [Gammaproteobacteria bacterium]
MALMRIGRLSARKLSKLSGLEDRTLSVPALLLLGFAVSLLHTKLNYSLGLPGHHGLELMTAMLFARLVARERWAASILALGTVAGDLTLATDFLHNLKHVPLYLLAGTLVDGSYALLGERCRLLPIAALIGGTVHLTKPVVMLAVAAISDASFGFMRHGDLFPLITHFAFGAVGAIGGALLARAMLERRAR